MAVDVVVVALRDDHACWLHPVGESGFAAPRGPVGDADWEAAVEAVVRTVCGDAAVETYHHCYVPQVIGGKAVFGVVTATMRGTATPSDQSLVPVGLTGLRGVAEDLAVDAPTVIALQAIALDGLPEPRSQDLTAFVEERRDRLRERFLGEFDCELSSETALKRGPAAVALAEALAWARAAAPRVTLQVGERRYSAGELESHDGYERWRGQVEPTPRPTGRPPLI